MRILLIGEYSRLHNSLKEGLIALGHEVCLVGTSDGFKNFPVDIDYSAKLFTNPRLKWFTKLIHKLTTVNLIEVEYYFRFKSVLPKLTNYDVVQLINERSIKTDPKLEINLLKQLHDQNKSLFLLSCGTDYLSVNFAHDKKFKYSILSPLFENEGLRKYYKFILEYISPKHKALHDDIYNRMNGVIASDLDYHMPLIGHPKYLGLIPNPINLDKNPYHLMNITDKIVIFHGINRSNYIKKGNRFFEKSLAIIKKKYPNQVQIITAENLPYGSYIKAFETCHILLDQVYAYDQGYNALEAMSKGKVVFTGAEKEWLDLYQIEEDTVAINALPDVNYLVAKIEWLILQPHRIAIISKQARKFIEDHHNLKHIADAYLKTWQENLNF